jgi:hypothetical protein
MLTFSHYDLIDDEISTPYNHGVSAGVARSSRTTDLGFSPVTQKPRHRPFIRGPWRCADGLLPLLEAGLSVMGRSFWRRCSPDVTRRAAIRLILTIACAQRYSEQRWRQPSSGLHLALIPKQSLSAPDASAHHCGALPTNSSFPAVISRHAAARFVVMV